MRTRLSSSSYSSRTGVCQIPGKRQRGSRFGRFRTSVSGIIGRFRKCTFARHDTPPGFQGGSRAALLT